MKTKHHECSFQRAKEPSISTLELLTVGNIKEEKTPSRRFSLKEKLVSDSQSPSAEGSKEESWTSHECNLGTRTWLWFESWWQWFLQWILPVFERTVDAGKESSSHSTTIGQSILQVEHRTRKRPCFQRDHHLDNLGVDGVTISEHDMAARNFNVETAGDSCFTKIQSYSGTSSADSLCSSLDVNVAQRRASSRVARAGGEVVDEGVVGVGKPVGIRAKLLSLSVVVVGLIGTVAVPLNVALFFTIIFSSCALVLLWIFILIQSHGKKLKSSALSSPSQSVASAKNLPDELNITKSSLQGRSENRKKRSENVTLHLIKAKAESQVEKYLFTLWWFLSLCDWFSSIIAIYLNDHHHHLNLSLDSLTWCVQIVAAIFAPTFLLSLHSGVLPDYTSSSSTFLPFIFFAYIIFVRHLGTFLYSSCFPYSLVIYLTSLTGLIFGRVVTNFIFHVIHLTSSLNGSADCADHFCCCSVAQRENSSRSSDHSSSPINLRRRSSDILNGTGNSAVATGIATPLVKETLSAAQIFAQVTPAAKLSITSINLPEESSFCDRSSDRHRGRRASDCSKSSSSSSHPYICLPFTSGRVKQEDSVATEKLTSHGEKIRVVGKAKELPGQSPPLAIKSGSADQLHQYQPQDQDHRRALNFFNLSRCHSVVHIVSNQGSEIEKMRRTSLPAALPAQRHAIHHGSTAGVDTAILLEAHGLVTDMLMDHAALPAHIVAGLKALATLLTPPPFPLHYQNPRPRPAPLTLSTDPDYTSDIDEIPYTGEKIWCMPKRNSGPCKKGGVSANLLRRMSTSTWTTTTSATGMPTLEPQPHARRRRSASFRTAMDGTPGSSPTQPYGMAMEANSMRTIQSMSTAGASSSSSSSAHVPNAALQASHKSRSFSANALYASTDTRRRYSQQELSTSQRKTVCSLHPLSPSDLTHLSALAARSANVSSTAAASSSSVLSSPAGTPIPSPLPSPIPSRDPSPSNPEFAHRRSSTPPKLLFHPRSSSFSVAAEDGVPGKTYLENPDDDNCSTASTLGDGPGPPLTSYNFPDNSCGASHRLSPVTFTLQEPNDDQQFSSSNDDDSGDIVISLDGTQFDLSAIAADSTLNRLSEWDYPIFDLELSSQTQILSHMCYKVFLEVGLFDTFKIPIREFINYFHALEMGYRDKPYHNRMHAADVLHGVYYLTSQPIPGFEMLLSDPETPCASDATGHRAWFNVEESSYGIMGANFPPLELMAMYTAAAMHDYDHPGRTNAFLVTTHAPQAILYNDRSVLENHHAAAAWSLVLSSDNCNFLKYLDKAEFKRFRYLVIEAILATDLKRHFEILAEFNAKANEDDSPGIDWNQEADRLLVMEMCIKLADINGPCKYHDIHVRWTTRIAEEFYEQGDEEERLGLPISPYMDRNHPQLAKLQESFINHLVAPLCKACAEAGILPGYWEDEDETADEVSSCQETDNDNDSSYSDDNSESKKSKRKILCLQTKHLQDNHRYWMNVIKEETRKKEQEGVKTESVAISTEDTMETIEEENNTPHSLNRSFSFEKEDSKL